MILAGDIGGTKTVLALYDESGFQIRASVFKSRDFPQFDQILHQFLANERTNLIHAICLGVAGPIRNGECKTTNLPWFLSERDLSKNFRVEKVRLLNDLEAAAYGMLFLKEDERVSFNQGSAERGNIAVIAAGTGLGEAILFWDGQSHRPMASEGGNTDFAPQSDQEVALFRYLQREFGHVSYERILSGPGIYNIYRFLRECGFENRPVKEPEWLTEKFAQGDQGAVVGEVGLTKKDPVCVEALSLFASIYGAEAGNLALKCFAVGGVFVGGGIAPKLISKLHDGSFMAGFTQKGRYADLMRSIPVHVALNSHAPLIGAAHYALLI